MTRAEAAAKVEKIRRLARRAGTAAEADTAKNTADKIVREHKLTEDELTIGAKVHAFDDLCVKLETFVRGQSVPGPVLDAITRLKTSASIEEKKKALAQIVGITRVASLFFGSSKLVSGLKKIIDETLAAHEVQI